MQLNKEILKKMFAVIEENMRIKGKFFNEQVRISKFGDLELRTFAGSFIFYIEGTQEQYFMFSVEFDGTGKVICFTAPAIIRVSVYWDLKNNVAEPEYHHTNIEEMMLNAVTNHFETAK